MDKKELRREMKARAEALEPEYIAESDEGIFRNILALPEYRAAKTVFMYYSEGREPDTRRLFDRAIRDGKTVMLPKITGDGRMEALRVSKAEELRTGAFGLAEPPDTAERVTDIDLIIVPAAAFDKDGYRLGRGGGYYDRFLAGSRAFTVGLARKRLLLDAVPREAHDMPVKRVVTE